MNLPPRMISRRRRAYYCVQFQRIAGLEHNFANENRYRKLAIKWHPDKNPNDAEAASKRFLVYAVLKRLSDIIEV